VQLGTVEQLKAAHRFYERNGFESIAKEDLPVYFPLMSTDTMFFQLHLIKN
jgi:predicted N-acetyltransferase YhbS